jgi:hypothetical protein
MSSSDSEDESGKNRKLSDGERLLFNTWLLEIDQLLDGDLRSEAALQRMEDLAELLETLKDFVHSGAIQGKGLTKMMCLEIIEALLAEKEQAGVVN